MARDQASATFNFPELDWDRYEKGRPRYPQALYAFVYGHHEAHGGRYDNAIDVGAGNGIVTKELLSKFKHVTLNDPAASYVQRARERFASVDPGEITYLEKRCEDLRAGDLAGRKLDLAIAAVSMHLTDTGKSISAIAGLLRPGGTFAAWIYAIRVVVMDNSPSGELKAAFDRLVDKLVDVYAGVVDQQDDKSIFAMMNSRFDCLDFEPSTWTDVRRVHAHRTKALISDDGKWPCARSSVRKGESVEDFDDQGMLSKEVDYEGVLDWVHSMHPSKFISMAEDELAEVERVLAGGKVRLEFPFALVLATKR